MYQHQKLFFKNGTTFILILFYLCNRLKGVLDSKNGKTAEIIPNEPEQVMLLREIELRMECTLSENSTKSFFNLTIE